MKSIRRTSAIIFLLTQACWTVISDSRVQAQSVTDSASVVQVEAWYTVNRVGQTELHVSANVREGFHIYATSQPKPFIAAEIQLSELESSAALTGDPIAVPSATTRYHEQLRYELHEHAGQVEWSAPVTWSPALKANVQRLVGTIKLQACEENRCLAPSTIEFTAELRRTQPANAVELSNTILPQPSMEQENKPEIMEVVGAAESELSTESAPTPTMRALASLQPQSLAGPVSDASQTPTWVALSFAFLGGLLLNLMPCVLPVIGLKVYAIVHQSGSSPGKSLALSVAHALGVTCVMLVLATLAVFAGLGWGEQFSSTTFTITLSAIVFVFALSLLGIWELSVPKLVGNAAATTDQHSGYSGAFAKGILTTLLATPCSGPLLGTALTWAVSQPAWLTYAGFCAISLGLSAPLLVLGTFPGLASWLPKPGAWMLTFKQLMGFVLLATVVYLVSFLPSPRVVPTLVMLLGLGIACWRIGQPSTHASRSGAFRNWTISSSIAVTFGLVAFGWVSSIMDQRFSRAVERELGWRTSTSAHTGELAAIDASSWLPYSRRLLEQLLSEGKTVFVDFTADWCLTCQANEAVAISHPDVQRAINQKGIVQLRADKTFANPDADLLLRDLGNRAGAIPYYAVFPSNTPDRPRVLDGIFTSPEPILSLLDSADEEHRGL